MEDLEIVAWWLWEGRIWQLTGIALVVRAVANTQVYLTALRLVVGVVRGGANLMSLGKVQIEQAGLESKATL